MSQTEHVVQAKFLRRWIEFLGTACYASFRCCGYAFTDIVEGSEYTQAEAIDVFNSYDSTDADIHLDES